jgi:hypothetical protein
MKSSEKTDNCNCNKTLRAHYKPSIAQKPVQKLERPHATTLGGTNQSTMWPEASTNLGKALDDKENFSVTSPCRSPLESHGLPGTPEVHSNRQGLLILPISSHAKTEPFSCMKASTPHGDTSSLVLCSSTRGISLDKNSCLRWWRICNKPFHQGSSKPQR